MANERELLTEVLPGYDLGREIGRGGWGVVFEATHRTLERRVAIKYLPAAFSADPSARDRFRSEARVVASLDHPHIVPLYDFVERDDTCVFVMELMQGGTLWERFSAGELSPEAACNITLALLGALHHAHERGVLHRDIKPENVLFNADGLPKLADFGIAKVLGDGAGTRTATGMILGTPAYMAPEQGSGDPLGPATDIYAIGAMLYELLSGKLPFESTGNPLTQLYRHVHEPPAPLRETAPQVPAGVAAVVMRALAKAPEDRFPDAATFAAELNDRANAAFGDDWHTRSGIRVLGTRAVLGRSLGASSTASAPQPASAPIDPPHDPRPAPPSTGAPAPSAPTPPPSAPAPAPTPAPVPTAASTPPPASGPSGSPHVDTPGTTPASPTAAPSSGGGRSRRGLLLGGGVAVVAVIVAVGVLLSGGDGEGGTPPDAADQIPAEAIARFEQACRSSGVDTELCSCALERSLDELSTEAFLENDRLLQETGDGLTAPVLDRFAACQQDLG